MAAVARIVKEVATTILSSAYRIEAMAMRLKRFLGFHWSDNETEGSSDLQDRNNHDQNGNSLCILRAGHCIYSALPQALMYIW